MVVNSKHDNQITIPPRKNWGNKATKGNSSSFRDRALCGAVTVKTDRSFCKILHRNVDCKVVWYRHGSGRVLWWHTTATLASPLEAKRRVSKASLDYWTRSCPPKLQIHERLQVHKSQQTLLCWAYWQERDCLCWGKGHMWTLPSFALNLDYKLKILLHKVLRKHEKVNAVGAEETTVGAEETKQQSTRHTHAQASTECSRMSILLGQRNKPHTVLVGYNFLYIQKQPILSK